MTRASQRLLDLLPGLLLALGIWAGIRAYLPLLHLWPSSTDGVVWASAAAISTPGWWRWDLLSPHFIGYRPLTALSFTIDSLFGFERPEPHRLMNLLLYALVGLFAFRVGRSLTGSETRSRWAGLPAALLLLAHPAAEEIVALEARRSYALFLVFGLAALPPWIQACREARWLGPSARLGALLLGASLLSNEEGFVLAAVLPLLAWALGPEEIPTGKRLLRASLLPAGVATLVFTARLAVIGHIGGYSGARPSLEKTWKILGDGVREVMTPGLFPSVDASAGLPLWTALLLLALLLASLFVPIFLPIFAPPPARRPGGPATRRVPIVLLTWLAGILALSALTAHWYHRQAWCAAVPLVLLVERIVLDALRNARTAPVAGVLRLLPPLLYAAPVLAGSPALRGMDPQALDAFRAHHARLEIALADLSRLPERSVAFLVPGVDRPRSGKRKIPSNLWYHGQNASRWLGALLRERGIRVRDAAFVLPHSGEASDLRLELVTPMRLWAEPGDVMVPSKAAETLSAVERIDGRDMLHLDRFSVRSGHSAWIYWIEQGRGRLAPLSLPERDEDAEEPGEPRAGGDED